eukprot:563538-Prorocentrum_minimum.AAC.2
MVCLIAPVTNDSDVHDSQRLGSVRLDARSERPVTWSHTSKAAHYTVGGFAHLGGPEALGVAVRVVERQRQGQHAREEVLHERRAQVVRVLHQPRLVPEQSAQVHAVPQRLRGVVEGLHTVRHEGQLHRKLNRHHRRSPRQALHIHVPPQPPAIKPNKHRTITGYQQQRCSRLLEARLRVSQAGSGTQGVTILGPLAVTRRPARPTTVRILLLGSYG